MFAGLMDIVKKTSLGLVFMMVFIGLIVIIAKFTLIILILCLLACAYFIGHVVLNW